MEHFKNQKPKNNEAIDLVDEALTLVTFIEKILDCQKLVQGSLVEIKAYDRLDDDLYILNICTEMLTQKLQTKLDVVSDLLFAIRKET